MRKTKVPQSSFANLLRSVHSSGSQPFRQAEDAQTSSVQYWMSNLSLHAGPKKSQHMPKNPFQNGRLFLRCPLLVSNGKLKGSRRHFWGIPPKTRSNLLHQSGSEGLATAAASFVAPLQSGPPPGRTRERWEGGPSLPRPLYMEPRGGSFHGPREGKWSEPWQRDGMVARNSPRPRIDTHTHDESPMVTNGCNGFPVPRVREHFVRPSIYIGHPTGYEKKETSNEKPPPDRDEHQHFYALTRLF